MKNIFLFISLFVIFGCSDSNVNTITSGNIDYEVIDTFYISKNGFGQILGYELIIKMDSSYYSCYHNGEITTEIYRKLKLK